MIRVALPKKLKFELIRLDESMKNYTISIMQLLIFTCFIPVMLYAHGTNEKGVISPAVLEEKISNVQIIDIRPLEEYEKSHIQQSISLPLLELSLQNLQARGLTKDKPIVVYAASSSQPQKAKLLLEVMGYTDVSILAGGFTHWIEDGHPVEGGISDIALKTNGKSDGPNFEIIPQSHDFGVIAQRNGVVTTQFTIKNIGQKDAHVENISTSCGCTSASIEQEGLLPNTETQVRVDFDPNYHEEPKGRFSRTVFLQMSSGEELEFRIYVQIKTE